jgi:large subunit ribosomal protein L22
MEAKSTAKYLRISPKKVRQVVRLIKGKSVIEALGILKYTPKKAALLVEKVLRAAVANAKQKNPNIESEALYIKHAYVDGGPILKRIRPRAMGRANRISKRTSHVTLIIGD